MNIKLKKNIVFIIGTRPEAIKLAPLILKFKSSNLFNSKVFLTGQHKEMVLKVLSLFQINYDYDLNLMLRNQTLCHITCKTLEGLEKLFKNEKPDLVFVQGDTTSAYAASLAAFYQKISIAHVEAGLRTNNLFDPYPEEANRRLISQLATYNFAPTKKSMLNLKNDNVPGEIYITGNTIVDAVLMISNMYSEEYIKTPDNKNKIILMTVHRRENWGGKIRDICDGINKLIKEFQNIEFIIPMHPNPIVRDDLKKFLINQERIKLIEPLSYQDLVKNIRKSYLIITDSGGIQEEAPTFGKPVLILRKTTERPEAVEAGKAKLIGTNPDDIFNEVSLLIKNNVIYKKMTSYENPYGDGDSCSKIFNIIKDKF